MSIDWRTGVKRLYISACCLGIGVNLWPLMTNSERAQVSAQDLATAALWCVVVYYAAGWISRGFFGEKSK